MSRSAIAGAVVSLLVATGASGQTRHVSRPSVPIPVTQGFSLGAYTVLGSGVTVLGPDIDGPFRTSMGEGFGVRVGYGFNSRMMVFASADLVRQPSEADYIQGSMGLSHLEIGGRLTFPAPRRRLVPYVAAVIGKRGVSASNGYYAEHDERFSLRMSGTEIGAGGGILYAFSPALSLDAGLFASQGKFDHATYRGDINDQGVLDVHGSTTMRLKVGFQWTPR